MPFRGRSQATFTRGGEQVVQKCRLRGSFTNYVYKKRDSVPLKPLFWLLKPKPKLADTVTDTKTTFQRENLVIDSMGYFFNHKGTSKIKSAAKY